MVRVLLHVIDTDQPSPTMSTHPRDWPTTTAQKDINLSPTNDNPVLTTSKPA